MNYILSALLFPITHGLCHGLGHHQGSDVETVNDHAYVEISLRARARRIFEELSVEKEIL
jgi:hypothetical protein